MCGLFWHHRYGEPVPGNLYEKDGKPLFDYVRRCKCGAEKIEVSEVEGKHHPNMVFQYGDVYATTSGWPLNKR